VNSQLANFPFGSLPLNPTFGKYPHGENRANRRNKTSEETKVPSLDPGIKIVDNVVQLPNININPTELDLAQQQTNDSNVSYEV
jgi:hypothetical protein